MNIKVLGPSCANCLKLEMLVMETLSELGIRDGKIEKLAVDREIERYLTGAPPGLVIDDQLVWSGGNQLPVKAQMIEWIRAVRAAHPDSWSTRNSSARGAFPTKPK